MTVIDLRAAREERARRNRPPKPAFRFHLEKTGTVLLEIDMLDVSYEFVFDRERLREFEHTFGRWAHYLASREEQCRRVAKGRCAGIFCKRLAWRGTGMCRRCADSAIERARAEEGSRR